MFRKSDSLVASMSCVLQCSSLFTGSFSPQSPAVYELSFFVMPWTVAYQAPLSMGFSRQEYWNGLPCPPLGGLPNPKIEPASLMSPALTSRFFTTNTTCRPSYLEQHCAILFSLIMHLWGGQKSSFRFFHNL